MQSLKEQEQRGERKPEISQGHAAPLLQTLQSGDCLMRKLYSIFEAGQRSQSGIPWPYRLSCPWVLLLAIGVHPLDPVPSAVPSWLLLSLLSSWVASEYISRALLPGASWDQSMVSACGGAVPQPDHVLLVTDLFHPEQITLIFIFRCSFQRGSLTVLWPGNSCSPGTHSHAECM